MSHLGLDEAIDVYTLTDSDFGEVEIRFSSMTPEMVAVAKAYIERNLPVGKNLALATIREHKRYGAAIERITEWQDARCWKHINNWKQYAKERDFELEKLLPLL